jgi:TolA-binding protein
MKNEADYNAGWTKQLHNLATGKVCAGGAARNLRLAMLGGISNVQVATATQVMQHFQPVIDAQNAQIANQQEQIKQMSDMIAQLAHTITGQEQGKGRR